ncbi:het-c2 protein [Phlebopus sp. FC_14]|nr:het-c2 protein [Phlebopus sp. FC_14]
MTCRTSSRLSPGATLNTSLTTCVPIYFPITPRTNPKSFADVPITDSGVDTLAFLEAAEGVVRLCKLLENPAFAPVVSDLEGNITFEATTNRTPPNRLLSSSSLPMKKNETKRPATEGLMWLLRGLLFTCKALQTAQSDNKVSLADAFTSGYEGSLKKYHNFVVQGIFSLAMKACPDRKDFYAKLASDPNGGPSVPQDELHEELNKWLNGLDRIVKRMAKVYMDSKYGEV